MASAYIKDDQGGTFIPASQRPDGTWRRPRRVKDGYVPQEEVPLYESKGRQFTKNKPTYPVGMSPEYVAEHKAKKELQASKICPIPGLVITNDNKKKKKKNKNKSTGGVGGGGVDAVTEDIARSKISSNHCLKENGKEKINKSSKTSSSNNTANNKTAENFTPNSSVPVSITSGETVITDPVKRIKNLRKKLREIETLEEKIKNCELKNPEKEIFDKISRKNDILNEINQIEDKL